MGRLEFQDCVKDSPRFRADIEEVETEVEEMEAKLEKLVKLCGGMVEAGKVYAGANKLFLNGVQDLKEPFHKDQMTSDCLEKCGDGLQELINYHMILFDQTQRSVKQQLHNFVKEDVRRFKETKKQLERVREDLEIAQVRNAQAPRNKPQEAEEASGALSVARRCFRHLALDYVLQINVLQAKKKFEILDAILSFMQAQFSLFQQGCNLLQDLQPYLESLATQLDQLVVDSAVEKREMERQHASVQQRTLLQDFSYEEVQSEVGVSSGLMEGFLFKRASNTFKTWSRRWFSIQNSQLVYQKKMKDAVTVVVEDLRLCSVKPCEDVERRFCFEVVSPSKSCLLQAESDGLRLAWIRAVQTSIASAYRESPDICCLERLDRTASPSSSSVDSSSEPRAGGGGGGGGVRGENLLQRLQNLPGNQRCCDCGRSDPRWASINLGVLLCIECSGIHRSLGVQRSKVRSLTLDCWEPELLKLMCELGNDVINHIYEGSAHQDDAQHKPSSNSSRQQKESWIRAKYVDRKFLKPMGGAELLLNGGGRKSERRWNVKKLRRHNSAAAVPKTRTRYRQEAGRTSPSSLSSAARFRRESLFGADELDSLFSYFDTSAGASGPRSLSSDSGLGGSTDGSCDIMALCSVVDSVTEEEASEDSGGEAELEAEQGAELETWGGEEVRDLEPAAALLYRASRARHLPAMAEALAHGADVNTVNEDDDGKTALIQAVSGGSLMACEFLLQNAADVDQSDFRGRGPLHHATYRGHTGLVCLFLKRGASQNGRDQDGRDPLSIAVQHANADIVTLLRLARLNQEMKASEDSVGSAGDSTYLDIFREFSHLASHNPEKLKRRSLHFRHSFR